jgi:hypothetical protein
MFCHATFCGRFAVVDIVNNYFASSSLEDEISTSREKALFFLTRFLANAPFLSMCTYCLLKFGWIGISGTGHPVLQPAAFAHTYRKRFFILRPSSFAEHVSCHPPHRISSVRRRVQRRSGG